MRTHARYYIGGGILMLLVFSLLYIFSRESPVGKNSETKDAVSVVPSENKASENIPAIVKESHADFIASIEDPDQRARYEAYTKTKRYQVLVRRTLKSLEEKGITLPSPEERAKKRERNKQRLDAALDQIRESQASDERQRARFTKIRDDLRRKLEESREQSARRKQWLDKILSATPTDTPIEPSMSEPRLDVPQTPQTEPVASFVPGTFREAFTEQVLEWTADIEAQYADVLNVPHLRPEEFDQLFPTEDARAELHERQAHLRAEIAQRVERVLTEAPGNRAEKLAIIRETLTENWSPDLAESVLERLR